MERESSSAPSGAQNGSDENPHSLAARVILAAVPQGYQMMDSIWEHPTTGAQIFVGNLFATKDADLLARHNVRHVVNTTDDLFNELAGSPNAPAYYMFDVGNWRSAGGANPYATADEIIEWLDAFFGYVQGALAAGESVLVHCLAGAHRAVIYALTQARAQHKKSTKPCHHGALVRSRALCARMCAVAGDDRRAAADAL